MDAIIAGSDELGQIAAERRRDYKQAEYFLLHYEAEAAAYNDRKAEYMTRPADENAGRRGAVGKPTESRALQSVAFDEKSAALSWLRAVDIAIRGLCDSKKILIHLRREAMKQPRGVGRPSWVVWVTMQYSEMVGRTVGESTIRRWISEVLWRVVDVHLRLEKNNLR